LSRRGGKIGFEGAKPLQTSLGSLSFKGGGGIDYVREASPLFDFPYYGLVLREFRGALAPLKKFASPSP